MPKVHDRGGWPNEDPIDQSEHVLSDWEVRVDALHMVLGEKGVRTTDEMRRAIESFLGEHPLVARFEPASPEHGGSGVTIIELKE